MLVPDFALPIYVTKELQNFAICCGSHAVCTPATL